MKKKLFIALLLIVVCANYYISSATTDKIAILLTFKSAEAMATPETACIGDPNRNTGKCKAQKGNSIKGASCVTPGFWDDKDCYDTVFINKE